MVTHAQLRVANLFRSHSYEPILPVNIWHVVAHRDLSHVVFIARMTQVFFFLFAGEF